MIGDWWPWLLVAVVVLAMLVGGFLLVRRQAAAEPVESLGAGPDDAPIPAVVANPLHVDPGVRERLEAVCASLGWAEPLWLETTVDDPGTGQAAQAVEKGADVVMACGGDGTVRAVAEALVGTGIAMGLVPLGTGNLLARTVGTPLGDAAAAVRIALTGDDRHIDVGRVLVDDDPDERLFLVMAGTGLDATIMENTPDELKARVGTLAYVISGLRGMFGPQMRVRIAVDDEPEVRRRSRTVIVGNSGTLLGGLVLMPEATIDDGKLDIVNVGPRGLAGWVVVLLRVLTRKHRGHRRLEHWQASTVTVTVDAPQTAQIDGDPIGEVTTLRMRVDPGVLVVRVPAEKSEKSDKPVEQ